MKTNHLFLLLCFVMLSCQPEEDDTVNTLTACSPSSFDEYDDYGYLNDDCMSTIYTNDFSQGADGMILDDTMDISLEVSADQMHVSSNCDEHFVRCLPCYESHPDHFQIEMVFEIRGYDGPNNSCSMAWGGRRNDLKSQHIRYGQYSRQVVTGFDKEGYPGNIDIQNYPPANQHLNWPGENKITIRKVFQTHIVFVNENLVSKMRNLNIDDDEIGIRLSGELSVDVKWFEYKEILR